MSEEAGAWASQRVQGGHREAKLSCVVLTGGTFKHLPMCWDAHDNTLVVFQGTTIS